MRIIWYPTFYCNNYNGSCPYCHEYGKDRYKKYTSWYESSIDKDNNRNTSSFFKKNYNIEVNITGGEPLLNHQKIIDVFDGIYNPWSINTNSQLTKNVIEFFDNMNMDKCLGVCCSYHPLAKKYDNYISSVQYICDKGIIPQINYVLTNDTIDVLYEHLYRLRTSLTRKIRIHLIREISSLYSIPPKLIKSFDAVIDNFDQRVQEQISKLRRKYRRRISIVQNDIKTITPSRPCRYNREHIILAPNGDIFPCSCFLYKNKKRVCNINRTQPILLKDPEKIIICSDMDCVLFHDQNKHQ